MAWFLTQSEGTASKCIYQLHMKCIKWNLTLVFDTTLCPDKKWTPRTLSIIALYGCGSLKNLMRNTVQQFLRKCANFCIKLCSMNEELNLLKISVLKIRFQTALRARAVDVINFVV